MNLTTKSDSEWHLSESELARFEKLASDLATSAGVVPFHRHVCSPHALLLHWFFDLSIPSQTWF